MILLVGLALACPEPAADLPPPWTALTRDDALPALAESLPGWCAAAAVDLDADGATDRAQLARGPEGFALLVDRGAGWSVLARLPALSDSPALWTLLRAKPAGAPVARDALPRAGARFLDPRAAVEVCAPLPRDAAGRPASLDPSALCLCSTFHAWGGDRPRAIEVCD